MLSGFLPLLAVAQRSVTYRTLIVEFSGYPTTANWPYSSFLAVSAAETKFSACDKSTHAGSNPSIQGVSTLPPCIPNLSSWSVYISFG